ncbi:MAG: divalent-cation tolerance protein CutA [Candidatus Peregrinibacteria bacterium]|nr:divalent-cation tolerance protein CutA [Candidatus Peregrinibacteria bacterium]
MKLSFGYITTPTKAEAKEIVLELLEQELIACANIVDGAESYFVWGDEINQAKEALIFFKTRAKNEDKIIKVVKSMHSYECPCIVFSNLEHGNADFLRWVDDSC